MDRLDEYDPATGRWRLVLMPQPLDHLGVAVVNNKLYTFGGFIGAVHQGASDAALEYDPARDTWRRLVPMRRLAQQSAWPRSMARSMSSAAACATTICWRHTMSMIPRPANGAMRRRSRSRVTTWPWWPRTDGFHAIGGRLSTPDEPTARHDIYDPGTNARTAGPPLPTPRSGVAAEAYRA